VIARYKLAWCHINQKDHKKAIALFEECVTSTINDNVDVDTYKRVDIKLEAFVDMAYCYPEIYKDKDPYHALSYFQKYAWSRPVYTTVLEKLAYRYYIKKKWHHAAFLYRELSELQHDADKLLEYARNTFECVQEIGKFEEADKDMAHIIKALKLQRYSIHVSEDDKKKNMTDYEIYARNIVTHLHEKARKEKSIESFARAAQSYKKYLDFFDNSPVYQDMEGNYAEALFSSNQFLEAGKIYEKVAQDKAKLAMHTQDALYSTVISYYSALKKKEEMNNYEVAYARDGLRKSGRLFAKYYPDAYHVPDVLFNVAWIAYDEGKYEQAVTEFTEFLKKYPHGKSANAAVHLCLDAFHLRENYNGLITFGKDLIAKNMIQDPKLLGEVRDIVKASEAKIVSSMTVAAVNNWEEGSSRLNAFADENQDTGLGEQALMALLLSGKEKGDIQTVYTTASKLIQQYPDSDNMENTLTIMIDTFSKASQYRILSRYMEIFANKFPNHKNSPEFLYQAGYIREVLGEYNQSNTNYRKYLSMGSIKKAAMEEIVFTMAQNDVATGDKGHAISLLGSYRNGLSGEGKIRSDAWMADLYLASGDFQNARSHRDRADKSYHSGIGKKNEMVKAAMAAMRFNALESSFHKYMKLSLGAVIDQSVVSEKSKLLQSLEKEYLNVIQYESAQWALKACYRSYEINREFAEFLEKSPLPDLSPEQQDQYKTILRKKIGDYMEKAEQYRNACMAQARKWETCDPELAGYFLKNRPDAHSGRIGDFSLAGIPIQVSSDFLKNDQLKQYHEKLMNASDDHGAMIALARAYITAGDYKQSVMIIKKTLEGLSSDEKAEKALAYNLMGVAYLYDHNDPMAKDAFQQALKEEPRYVDAKVNLAGLYTYYGHLDQAKTMYDSIEHAGALDISAHGIHPRAKELYDDAARLAKYEEIQK
jgi:tetratricopeptide (TPR) repeat protein